VVDGAAKANISLQVCINIFDNRQLLHRLVVNFELHLLGDTAACETSHYTIMEGDFSQMEEFRSTHWLYIGIIPLELAVCQLVCNMSRTCP